MRFLSFLCLPLLVFILGLAPLLLGGNREWAWSGLAVLVGLLGVLTSLKKPMAGHPQQVEILRYATILYVLPLCWAAGNLLFNSSIVDVWAGWQRLLKLASYLAVFLITVKLTHQRHKSKKLLNSLAVLVAGYALIGLVLYFTGSDTVLLQPKTAYLNDLTGTFVNRNSWATFMGLGLLCCFTALLMQYDKLWQSHIRHFTRRRDVLVQPRLYKHYLACGLTMGALLLSNSRAGFLATICGVLLLLALHLKRKSYRYLAALPFLIIAVLVTVLLLSSNLAERLLFSNFSTESRFEVWALAYQSFKGQWLTGIGLGNFETQFLAVKTSLTGHYHKLHNDWLENIIELGVPAAICLFTSIIMICWQCLQGALQRKRNPLYATLAVAAGVLAGLHAIVDFSLQMPAVSYWFAAILGIGFVRSFPAYKEPY